MYLLTLYISAFLYSGVVQTSNPLIIYSKAIEEQCATFEILDHGTNDTYFLQVLEKRDDAAFYYTNEDKKEILIQKKLPDNQYLLKYIFVIQKNTYEIVLKSCHEQLSQNKQQLYILQEKIKDKVL